MPLNTIAGGVVMISLMAGATKLMQLAHKPLDSALGMPLIQTEIERREEFVRSFFQMSFCDSSSVLQHATRVSLIAALLIVGSMFDNLNYSSSLFFFFTSSSSQTRLPSGTT